MFFKYMPVAVLTALMPCVAVAGQFEDGLAAAKLGDHQRAFGLWRPLAEQGDAASQFNLGLMYENGQGIPKDYAKAVKWYLKAARQGSARAQVSAGHMYNSGRGVAKDYAKAVEWNRKAATQGSAMAQNSLGGSYSNGKGVTQDYVQAHMWFSLAAAQGNKTAGKNRDLIAERMTPAQIGEAQKLAREWHAD